ncbi:hypothetical protein PSY81_23995, partial [Shigella flexneri]|nr:hypothetical protein [Shigella flexneri]
LFYHCWRGRIAPLLRGGEMNEVVNSDAMFITPEFTTSFISPPLSRGAILPLLERKNSASTQRW